MGGHRKCILEPHRDFIIDQINRTPHLMVRGLQAIVAECGIIYRIMRSVLSCTGKDWASKKLFGLEQGSIDADYQFDCSIS